MPFGKAKRREVLERAGYSCEVCGADGESEGGFLLLNGHSIDHSHEDEGVSVCSVPTRGGRRWGNNCHSKIHTVSRHDPEITEDVTRCAIEGDNHGVKGQEYLDAMYHLSVDP